MRKRVHTAFCTHASHHDKTMYSRTTLTLRGHITQVPGVIRYLSLSIEQPRKIKNYS